MDIPPRERQNCAAEWIKVFLAELRAPFVEQSAEWLSYTVLAMLIAPAPRRRASLSIGGEDRCTSPVYIE